MTNIPIPKVTSLSEITLEQDDQDLDKFLESTEAENTGRKHQIITVYCVYVLFLFIIYIFFTIGRKEMF